MKFLKPDLHWLVLCISALVFFAVGEHRVFHSSNDFVPAYTGARCMLHGCNPYDTSQLEQQFSYAGGRANELPSWDIDVPVYPPSTFLVLGPLALLQFPVARLLWFLLNSCLFVTSVVLILSICPPSHRWLATILGSLVLATSGILLVLGQPAVCAISLVVIASYLFLRGRLLPLGSFLFMLSLAIKPQIGGLIVLYFLAQKTEWRYAAVALAGALAILLSAGLILHLRPHSADWPSTLRGNLTATLSPGGSADPRPTNQQSIGDTNLQALTSIFFTDAPKIQCCRLRCLFGSLRSADRGCPTNESSPGNTFPFPRRLGGTHANTRLSSLLRYPAASAYHSCCSDRFQKRRLLGALIAVLTVLAIISIQYRMQIFLLQRAEWQFVLPNKLLFILLLRQQNLELLILFSLYLFAIFSIRFTSPPPIESDLAYPAAVTVHRRGPAMLSAKHEGEC